MDTLLTCRVDKQNGKRVLYEIIFFLNIALSGKTHCHISSRVQAAQLVPSLAIISMLSSRLPQAQKHGTKGFEGKRWREQKPWRNRSEIPRSGFCSFWQTARWWEFTFSNFGRKQKKKGRRSRLPVCGMCRVCESYSEYRKYSERSSVGGWESGTDVTGDDGSALPTCQGEAGANNAALPKWDLHFLYIFI